MGKLKDVRVLGPELADDKVGPARQPTGRDWAECRLESLGDVGVQGEKPEVSP